TFVVVLQHDREVLTLVLGERVIAFRVGAHVFPSRHVHSLRPNHTPSRVRGPGGPETRNDTTRDPAPAWIATERPRAKIERAESEKSGAAAIAKRSARSRRTSRERHEAYASWPGSHDG